MIEGLGTGSNGINVTSVGTLHIEGCVIRGFTAEGIGVNLAADGSYIFIKDTITRNNSLAGVFIRTSTGTVRASIDNCRSERNGNEGFLAHASSRVTINRSVASGNAGSGFAAISNVLGATTELSCEECVSSNNAYGFRVDVSATIRVSHSTATNNTEFGFLQNGGVFKSLGNNLLDGNTTANTSGAITPITLQ
jgi:nitrous oxidase accessory protein NosD